MTQKPKQPAAIAVIPVFYIAALWAYPVVPSGLGNLAAFVAWGFASLAIVVLLIDLCQPAQEGKYQPTAKPVKWMIRVCVWGGIVWLAYHGAFALAGVVVTGCLLAAIAVWGKSSA